MKKIISLFALALVGFYCAAMPAKPGFRSFTQPDGKTLVLEQRGDEFANWFVDKNGNRYNRDADGFFHLMSEQEVFQVISLGRNLRRRMNASKRDVPFTDMTHGTRKIPVILVEFTDVKFTIDDPHGNFDKLLNETGYNGYRNAGATGSVRDFYMDNSHGAFEPVFDIYGPVQVDTTLRYYGKREGNSADAHAELALYDACLKLENDVDFSQYDYDNDGYVDMTLFYYAGGSEAEGWDSDAIWPHQWSVQNSSSYEARSHRFNGKRLDRYFCTAELKGQKGRSTMCSIGPTCHEFGHSLGLPDFYDTNYEEDGDAGDVYIFSTMCSGPYLDDQRTPPYFGAEERIMLGWMEKSNVQELVPGAINLHFIDENTAYKTSTTADDEYFLYESRGGTKWDKAVPRGLVVYHVDKCPYHDVNGVSAYNLWYYWEYYNSINNYAEHPCYYTVAAPAPEILNYSPYLRSYSDLVFPGSYNVTDFHPIDWQGVPGGISISNITAYADGTVTFNAEQASVAMNVSGTVKDTYGSPLQDAIITITAIESETKVAGGICIRKESSPIAQTTTDASGKYSCELPEDAPSTLNISVSKDGYVGQSRTVVYEPYMKVSFTLRSIKGDNNMEFTFFGTDQQWTLAGEWGQKSGMLSSKCTPESWAAYEGLRVKEVSLYTYNDAENYYFVMDTEDGFQVEKAESYQTNNWTTIDLSSKEYYIPSGEFYMGYAIENAIYSGQYQYPFAVAAGGSLYYSSLTMEPSWTAQTGYSIIMMVTLTDEPAKHDLTVLNHAFIDFGKEELKAGDSFKFTIKFPEGVQTKPILWTLDGQRSSSTVTLTSGWHTVMATITYNDGTTEELEAEFEVK